MIFLLLVYTFLLARPSSNPASSPEVSSSTKEELVQGHHSIPSLGAFVIRCSDGIQQMCSGEWKQLKPGEKIHDGMRLRMPGSHRSILSFRGIRLMTEGPAEITVHHSDALSLNSGKLALATGKLENPFSVTFGPARAAVESNSILTMEADPPAVTCISGEAAFSTSGEEHRLEPHKQALVFAKEVQVVSTVAQNPFAGLNVTTMDRIQDRFQKIVTKYAGKHVKSIEKSLLHPALALTGSRFDGGIRFVSYARPSPPTLAKTDTTAVAEYYESLFSPSNRSIAIGKEKIVSVTPYSAASWPMWSHDGSMIAFIETSIYSWQARVRVARLDDLDHPWDISQDYETVLPYFPIAWAPDNRHVLFMTADHMEFGKDGYEWWWAAPLHLKIAPIDPNEGPIREFESPLPESRVSFDFSTGRTMAPIIMNLPWGDALLCANAGNLAYIPIEPDGQAVAGSPGFFLTSFHPYKCYIAGGIWAPSGNKILFAAGENMMLDSGNVYILYDIEDILDGVAPPPISLDDPRIKRVAPSPNTQLPASFSYDESLVFYQEDVNRAWKFATPKDITPCDFDLVYADARPNQPSKFSQIHLAGNQAFLRLSPEGNRLVYAYYNHPTYELRVVTFDIEADMDMDLGGVLIDNSGTNLIVPPGALEENFKVKISTPFTIEEETEVMPGETPLFAMRMLDAQGLEKPKFIEPMTLTIRYTDDEVAGLDEGMLEIYCYDESDPAHPVWTPLGGTVDSEHNEITIDIQHFSSFSVGPKNKRN